MLLKVNEKKLINDKDLFLGTDLSLFFLKIFLHHFKGSKQRYFFSRKFYKFKRLYRH